MEINWLFDIMQKIWQEQFYMHGEKHKDRTGTYRNKIVIL